MIYPKNFEQKIGFTEVRSLLRARCLSTLGKERIDAMNFSTDDQQIDIHIACAVQGFKCLTRRHGSVADDGDAAAVVAQLFARNGHI